MHVHLALLPSVVRLKERPVYGVPLVTVLGTVAVAHVVPAGRRFDSGCTSNAEKRIFSPHRTHFPFTSANACPTFWHVTTEPPEAGTVKLLA